jgi:restriction system protein
MSKNRKNVPSYENLMNPMFKALKELGGSGNTEEIYDKVLEILGLPDNVVEILHSEEGSLTEIGFRLAYARTYLKKHGILENSARGVWGITKDAMNLKRLDTKEIMKKVRETANLEKKKQKMSELPINSDDFIGEESERPKELQIWRDTLRNILPAMPASAFERLTQRILREAGFIQAEVTGKSADGGIDGKGIVRINGILSFHVMFQCKRYQGTVSSSLIRDFRGAMQGRADKGIFITTGTYSREAIKEANRDGAIPIDLIDGEQLIDKLKEFSLGVKTKIIEKIEVDSEWFNNV